MSFVIEVKWEKVCYHVNEFCTLLFTNLFSLVKEYFNLFGYFMHYSINLLDAEIP